MSTKYLLRVTVSTITADVDIVINQTSRLHEDYEFTNPNDVADQNIGEEYRISYKKMYLIKVIYFIKKALIVMI